MTKVEIKRDGRGAFFVSNLGDADAKPVKAADVEEALDAAREILTVDDRAAERAMAKGFKRARNGGKDE